MPSKLASPDRVAEAVPWHALAVPEALDRLGTSPAGLSSEEAARRLAERGRNELRQPDPIRPLALLAAQFRSLIVGLLIAAAVTSGLFGEWIDCGAILSIVVLNALVGFYQEFSAERSLAALRKLTAPRCRVRRDGSILDLPAAEIVPGDVVELEAGDLVPADARLLEAFALRCNEASLSGESEPVEKDASRPGTPDLPLGDRADMAYMGTSVVAGKG